MYRTVANHVCGFEESRGIKILSNSYTSDVAEDFVDYLKDRNLMKTTISGYIEKTAYMFRRMSKAGYDVDFSFEYVHVEKEKGLAVYVTLKELEKIYALKFNIKATEVVRDMFVANCFIGMRYGDYSELTAANVIGNIIYRKTKKTGETVEVPVHRIVAEILQKYNGNFPPYSKSQQNYNKVIKNICKRAGLNDKVLWERTKGNKVIRKTFKRYELISSHTARRSFATNAYLSGIPSARVMQITGHKTEQAFFTYICIQKRENALTLAKHSFFL